jgi:hypothetical protein
VDACDDLTGSVALFVGFALWPVRASDKSAKRCTPRAPQPQLFFACTRYMRSLLFCESGESDMRAIAKLLGAWTAMVVLLVGASALAQDAAKKPAKTKSACNVIKEQMACQANASCRWIAPIMDEKTGKQKRKAYCRTQGTSAKKSSTPTK